MKSLRRGMEDYLEYRWRLGFMLHSASSLLPQFVTFMEQRGEKYITTELALMFASINPRVTSTTWASRLGIIRRFALYWSAIDPRTEIPPKNLLSHSYERRSPYIYTDAEIIKLLECPESGFHNDRFDQYVYFVLFGLLAVTGMRITEALTLNRDDVDLHNQVITVRLSKYRKSRYIPIHSSTTEVLKNFVNYRDLCFPDPTPSQFFIDRKGQALTAGRVRDVFHKRLKKIGIANLESRCSPRIMDLRHTFAVKTLLRWYKQGVNTIDHYIPLLATYLGHHQPTDTYWYLTATPQLLKFVLLRCKNHKRRTKS